MTMIKLRTWDWVAVGGVIALVGVFIVDLAIPNPSILDNAKRMSAEQAKMKQSLRNDTEKLEEMKEVVAGNIWTGNAEQVSSAVLNEVTRIGRTSGVKVSSFRPQRVQETAGMNLQSYTFTAEGKFPGVHNLIKYLEGSRLRLGVTQAQISSADAESDVVAANITLAVYVDSAKKEVVTRG